jgi:pyruvate,water dikinase
MPGWREQPELVIQVVQKYLPQDLDALLAARAAATEARDQRTAEVRAGIDDTAQRARFDFLLDAARRHVAAFEDHNYYLDSAANSLLHRAVAAAGRRLTAAGALDTPDDVWWLHVHELTAALRGLDAAAQPSWLQLVGARKALHEWYRSLTPPATLGAPPPGEPKQDDPPPAGAAAQSEPEPEPERLLIKGQAGSAGQATGRVRLIPRDALVPDVEPGDVLVAHNAGPIWTPVFPTLAAVVLDEGVLFQHAMLTCREYGVPAVFQTKDSTKRLREGQRVTVDGARGWVLAAD